MTPETTHKLPEGWRWVRLGDVTRLVNGNAYKPRDWAPEGVRIIRIQNLNDLSSPFNHWRGPLDGKVVVRDGDVLLAWSGTPGTSFGAHRWQRGDAVLNQHIFRVDIATTDLSPGWLVLAVNHGMSAMIAKAHGGVGLRHVKRGEVESLPIPLPPLPEQRRIAALLTEQMAQVDKARAAAEAQLQAAQELPAACLRDVFGGEEAQRWPLRRLGDVLVLRKEIVHPRDNPSGPAVFVGLEHIESGTGLRTGGVPVEMSDLSGRKPRFYSGDIVYGYLRPYLNKVWLADFDGLCSVDQYVYDVHRAKALPEFVAAFMRSPIYIERAPVEETPGQLPRIRTEEVATVPAGLPDLATQQAMVTRLGALSTSARSATTALRSQLASINELPAALLRQAFSGEL